MALWLIERDGTQVRLTYVENPASTEPMVHKCGQAELAVMKISRRVIDLAGPWDACTTADGGTFVRQTVTTRGAAASA
jgi:hypothetical protein